MSQNRIETAAIAGMFARRSFDRQRNYKFAKQIYRVKFDSANLCYFAVHENPENMEYTNYKWKFTIVQRRIPRHPRN